MRSSVDKREGSTHSQRIRDDLIETFVSGRVTGRVVRDFGRDFVKLGGAPFWLFRAEGAESYGPTAIAEAVEVFRAAQAHRLIRAVAVITNPVVRMGAITVSMSLRTLGAVDLRVVEAVGEAELWLRP